MFCPASQQPGNGVRIAAPDRLSPGDHTITLDFLYDGQKGDVGKGGNLRAGRRWQESRRSEDCANGSVHLLRLPFPFDGVIQQVTIELKPPAHQASRSEQ